MKILITGFSGFIGKHLLNHLLRTNYEIILVGRKRPVENFKNCTYYELNLMNFGETNLLISKIKPQIVIHLAWNVEHGKYWDSPKNLQWMDASINLAHASGRSGCKKIFMAGTCAEYDWANVRCLEKSSSISTNTMYSLAKNLTRIEVEKIALYYGFVLTWGRIFFPFGPGESKYRLFPSILNSFINNQPFDCRNGNFIRDFIYASDIASAIKILAVNHDIGGIYNISSGSPTKISDLIEECSKLFQNPPLVNYLDCSPTSHDPIIFYGDNSQLKSTGWRQKYTIKSAIKDYLSHLR